MKINTPVGTIEMPDEIEISVTIKLPTIVGLVEDLTELSLVEDDGGETSDENGESDSVDDAPTHPDLPDPPADSDGATDRDSRESDVTPILEQLDPKTKDQLDYARALTGSGFPDGVCDNCGADPDFLNKIPITAMADTGAEITLTPKLCDDCFEDFQESYPGTITDARMHDPDSEGGGYDVDEIEDSILEQGGTRLPEDAKSTVIEPAEDGEDAGDNEEE